MCIGGVVEVDGEEHLHSYRPYSFGFNVMVRNTYVVMAYVVIGHTSLVQRDGEEYLCSYGLCSYGPYSCGGEYHVGVHLP